MADKKQISIKEEVKRRMKKENPISSKIETGLSPITHLRKYLHKKQIKKELKDRPEHLSPARVKLGHGGVGIQTHGNKLASALNTQTPDDSVYLNKDGYLKGGIKVRS